MKTTTNFNLQILFNNNEHKMKTVIKRRIKTDIISECIYYSSVLKWNPTCLCVCVTGVSSVSCSQEPWMHPQVQEQEDEDTVFLLSNFLDASHQSGSDWKGNSCLFSFRSLFISHRAALQMFSSCWQHLHEFTVTHKWYLIRF